MLNSKTIAVIESCDTKAQEAGYIKELIEKAGLKALVIDVSTGNGIRSNYDVSRDDVAASSGVSWSSMTGKSKGEKIAFMQRALQQYLEKIFDAGMIDGVMSVGGLQNTILATGAMQRLPIGFPKVMATTIACGGKTFGPYVGDKDIVMIPSIADFTGLNIVTSQIIANATAACVGMVEHAGDVLKKSKKPVVGVTLMGVTNIGACAAISELERLGIEGIGFHATGVGGPTMEKLAAQGLIDGILDMNVHEITEEYFGHGFSYGKDSAERLRISVKAKVPLVIAPGGIDFIDFEPSEYPPRMNERKFMMHNAEMAHIKLLPDEVDDVMESFVERLQAINYPVKVLLPTDGMRHNTQRGEELYWPEVDQKILDKIRAIKNPNLEIITVPGNLDTKEWGIAAAHYMIDEMKERNAIPDCIKY